MDNIIAQIGENPVLGLVAVFLVGVVLYAVMKRLMKIAVVMLLGFLGVAGYFAYTDKEPPSAIKQVQDKAKKAGEDVSDKVGEGLQKAGEKIGQAAQDKLKKALDRD